MNEDEGEGMKKRARGRRSGDGERRRNCLPYTQLFSLIFA
jgi:hypothetical protein